MAELNFKLTQIGVVMLGVEQLARAVAFYRDKLGLALKGQNEGFAFFDGGGVTLGLSEALARASSQIPGAVEVVFSVENVRAAHQALAARGVQFTHEPRTVTGPLWAANFNDPDGHPLSVFGPEGIL
ncbi:MAG: VOC family protein [Acidobacteriia bacterium]|nr:VOC family protein [Terriglobia bacterium]